MDASGTRTYYATIAPFYDTELAARDDLHCWLAVVAAWKPRRSIEYGCGTGRVAIPLALQGAQWGGDVAGLDLSPAMLRLARRHWERARCDAPSSALLLHLGDMRRFSLDHAVDLAVFANDPLTHLAETDDLVAAFRRVGEQLRPGGHLMVEASLLPAEARGRSRPMFLQSRWSANSATGRIDIEQERSIDPVRGRADVVYRYRLPTGAGEGASAAIEARFVAHYLDLGRLQGLFGLAGCRLEERWSDFQYRAFRPDSAMILCTGTKY